VYIVEHDEIKDNMRIVVIFGSMGSRCGYVGVTKDHPFFNKDYNDPTPINFATKIVDVMRGTVGKRGVMDVFCAAGGGPIRIGFLFDVHGSITYSGGNNYPTHNEGGKWWFFGFDCAHYGDAKDLDCADKYGFKIYSGFGGLIEDGEVRTFDYVLEECYNLASQLKEVV
jgi:hypothetical protein